MNRSAAFRVAPAWSADRVPGDAEIRALLKARLAEYHQRDPGTMLIEEFGICRGQVRIDVATVNGVLHGYEIKSDRDSLCRLVRQVEFYNKVLDRATLVVGARHVDDATRIVPVWWEIQTFERAQHGAIFTQRRPGRENPSRVARALVELVWLDDALRLLAERDAVRGYRGKPRRLVWDRVCELYSLDEIATAVRRHLKAHSADGVVRRTA